MWTVFEMRGFHQRVSALQPPRSVHVLSLTAVKFHCCFSQMMQQNIILELFALCDLARACLPGSTLSRAREALFALNCNRVCEEEDVRMALSSEQPRLWVKIQFPPAQLYPTAGRLCAFDWRCTFFYLCLSRFICFSEAERTSRLLPPQPAVSAFCQRLCVCAYRYIIYQGALMNWQYSMWQWSL